MVLSNETILIEQYANDRGPGREVRGLSSPEAETLLAFGCSMEAANLSAFKYGDAKKTTVICSLHDPKLFSLTFQK